MGLQGSGKGTQVELLEKSLRSAGTLPVFHFATGSAFREFVTKEGYTQELVRETLDRGTLQPVFLSVWLWADAFVRTLTGNEHLIIDGFPRTLLQADVLDGALTFYKRERPVVLSLTLSESEAYKRLAGRARSDDTTAAIDARLAWYRESGLPVIEYYRSKQGYTFIEINGEQTVEEVHRDIVHALGLPQ